MTGTTEDHTPDGARWTVSLADERETIAFAQELSLFLKTGDVLALRGDLGAGKTTLARAIVRAVAGDGTVEVPSPTFTLVQTYETPRADIAHFDLYRVSDPAETDELAFDEACETSIVLVEWPDRLGGSLPARRLDVTLLESAGGGREVALEGTEDWPARIARMRDARAFLDRAGWSSAARTFFQGDASSRRYERLDGDSGPAIFMDMPAMPDGPPVRDGKPYSRIAHIAEDVRPFVAVAGELSRIGLSAPEILAADLGRGFLVTEDFGDLVYGRLIAEGADMTGPYAAAVAALLEIRASGLPDEVPLDDGTVCTIPAYDRDALAIETQLLLDWMWPQVTGGPCPGEARVSFDGIWTDLFDHLQRDAAVWCLRDFHSPNLMWLPDREGARRAGLLDFQDTVRGHPAYDLVSMLQDARTDRTAGFERKWLDVYLEGARGQTGGIDEEAFRLAYAILGAQRATKILGIFVRLARRDGKPQYLRHIPRVSGYLERNLSHPGLEDLRAWYDRHLPETKRSMSEAQYT